MDIKFINSDSPVKKWMNMIVEHRLLNRNFNVKIWLKSNPTNTCFSYWEYLINLSVNYRYFLIPKHGSKIVITHETFHYLFFFLTLLNGASNKILKTNIEMGRYLRS